MTTLWQWLVAHRALIVTLFSSTAFASAVSTVVNVYGDPDHNPDTPPPKWVLPFIVIKNLLALRAGEGRKGIDGLGDGGWSVPLLHYPKVGVRVPSRNGVRPGSAGVLLFLIPALLLNGCGFGTCLLGKLQAKYQTLIEEVTADLVSSDYVALLAQLSIEAGSDAVTCAVQAVVTYEQSKQQKLQAGAHLKAMPDAILDHGQAWLNMRKPVACNDRHAS